MGRQPAGRHRRVLPPLKPVKVEGRRSPWCRANTTVDGLGLWQSVRAEGNVSAGGMKELLAAPMALVADGTVLQGQGRFTKTASAGGRLRRAGPAPGRDRQDAIHYGMRRLHESRTDAPARRRQAELKPVAGHSPEGLRGSAVARLHHGPPHQPGWQRPPGKASSGTADSSRTASGSAISSATCGWEAEERGLVLVRRQRSRLGAGRRSATPGEVGALPATDSQGRRAHAAGQPGAEADHDCEPRTITFGLMASPAKPMQPNWRRVGISDESTFMMGYAYAGHFLRQDALGQRLLASPIGPTQQAHRQSPARARRRSRNGNSATSPRTWIRSSAKRVINLALGLFVNTFGPGQKYYKMYFDEFHTTSQAHPESHVFQSEWSGSWHSPQSRIDRPPEPLSITRCSVSARAASYRAIAILPAGTRPSG